MKKTISLLLCLLLTVPLAVTACADVIWEPNDSFYEMHFDDCIYINSDYEAQGEAEIREDPESDKTLGTIAKGEIVYIGYIWPQESAWGYVENGDGGWVSLADFRRLYNADDFYSEHAADISDDSGSTAPDADNPVVLWTFPGSGVIVDHIGENYSEEDDIAYSGTWTDEDGRTWGNVQYYYGLKGWICLTDLSAEDLPETAPYYAEEQPVPADSPEIDAGPSVPVLVIVLVAAVVAVTAAVIFLLTRKKKN